MFKDGVIYLSVLNCTSNLRLSKQLVEFKNMSVRLTYIALEIMKSNDTYKHCIR